MKGWIISLAIGSFALGVVVGWIALLHLIAFDAGDGR